MRASTRLKLWLQGVALWISGFSRTRNSSADPSATSTSLTKTGQPLQRVLVAGTTARIKALVPSSAASADTFDVIESVTTKIYNIAPWTDAHVRDIGIIQHIVIHRNTKGANALELAKWLHDEGYKWTGSKRMSYHFVIRKDGTVDQAVPLHIEAPGAKGMNRSGVQIALCGDFRKHRPTKEQMHSAKKLCAMLTELLPKAKIVGHDPKKPCPGKHLSVDNLRLLVREYRETASRNRFRMHGGTL